MAEAIVNETELEPAVQLSAGLDDALMVVSEAVAGNEQAEQALDELVRQLNAHASLTWRFDRWWNYRAEPVNTDRWFEVVAAFRAAMEMRP